MSERKSYDPGDVVIYKEGKWELVVVVTGNNSGPARYSYELVVDSVLQLGDGVMPAEIGNVFTRDKSKSERNAGRWRLGELITHRNLND